jgi:uncharacterized protein
MKTFTVVFAAVAVLYVLLLAVVYFRQRSMLFFPSHSTGPSLLSPWVEGEKIVGYAREIQNPRTVWLMMHGNAGQASTRDYVLRCLSPEDALYVLEYPGYGSRSGSPTLTSMNQAAEEGYHLLQQRFPRTPICVIGESIGSGPACHLAEEPVPPSKIVLVVPFDELSQVAARHFRFLPVRWLLRDSWNNIKSLGGYRGPVDIFAAKEDTVIPPIHAQNLAQQVPTSRLVLFAGGQNEWSNSPQVILRR